MPGSREYVNAWKARNRDRTHAYYLKAKAAHPEKYSKPRPILTDEQKRERTNANARRWRAANLEKSREIGRKADIKRRPHKKAWKKEWVKRNLEHVKAKKKAWYAAHPDSGKETKKQWRLKNIDRLRKKAIEITKRYAERHPDRVAIYKSRSHVKRKAKIENAGNFTLEEWNALLDRQNHLCAYCGIHESESIYRYPRKGFALKGKLTVDHIIALSKNGTGTIDNIAAVCLPCNMRKHNKAMVVTA